MEPIGEVGFGEYEDDARVGEAVMVEIRGKGWTKVEEPESERGGVQGFENLGGFVGSEGNGEGREVVLEAKERVGGVKEFLGSSMGLEEDLGGFADELTAGEWVATRVGGERLRRGYFG